MKKDKWDQMISNGMGCDLRETLVHRLWVDLVDGTAFKRCPDVFTTLTSSGGPFGVGALGKPLAFGVQTMMR